MARSELTDVHAISTAVLAESYSGGSRYMTALIIHENDITSALTKLRKSCSLVPGQGFALKTYRSWHNTIVGSVSVSPD